MDLKQLEYFVHVAELGSFTRASRVLQVAQPALSRQVRALEVELRQGLLQRNGRGVTLTEAGTRLLAHGRGILQQVERARQDLEDHRGAPVGHVGIGLPPSVSRLLTGPLVQAFREQLPKATLTVVEGLSTYALEWLLTGRIDAAVVYNVTPAPAFELQPVLDEPLYLVSARGAPVNALPGKRKARREAPSRSAQRQARSTSGAVGAPVSLQQVAECALVIPSRPHSIRMLLETALAGIAARPRIAFEIESVPAMLDLVERDGLHAVLSLKAIATSGRAAQFSARPIGPPPLVTTLWIATSAQRPRGPLLEQATALLAELLRSTWGRADASS